MRQRMVVGDCRAVMAGMEPASFAACVCDPPYDLTTGKKGGSGERSLNLAHPGGRARITTGGFMGARWDATGIAFDPATWEAVKRILVPGGVLMAFGGTRTWHRLAVAIEDAGFVIFDTLMWLHGQGFPKHKTLLKPAWEPVIVAKKPGAGGLNTEAGRLGSADSLVRPPISRDDNAVYGKGLGVGVQHEPAGRWPANLTLSHLDACREVGVRRVKGTNTPGRNGTNGYTNPVYAPIGGKDSINHYADPDGRESVVAWECADGCPVRLLDEQAGESVSKGGGRRGTNVLGIVNDDGWQARDMPSNGHDDAGGKSRFFYTSKASSRERTAGLHPGERNLNPCVKPLALCEWLLKLAVPPGGGVLDPFAGSGSLGCAAARLGIDYLGVEQDAAMADQARRRIAHHAGPIFAALAAD
jgi:site-specific DNA-methyltransferase (adenine-specific)